MAPLGIFDTICNATESTPGRNYGLGPQVDWCWWSVHGPRPIRFGWPNLSAPSAARPIGRLERISTRLAGRRGEHRDSRHSAGASTPEFLVEAVIQTSVELSGGKPKYRPGTTGTNSQRRPRSQPGKSAPESRTQADTTLVISSFIWRPVSGWLGPFCTAGLAGQGHFSLWPGTSSGSGPPACSGHRHTPVPDSESRFLIAYVYSYSSTIFRSTT